jgi:hypothetical protein
MENRTDGIYHLTFDIPVVHLCTNKIDDKRFISQLARIYFLRA